MQRQRQARGACPSLARAQLVKALNHAAREASGLGIVFGQAVAQRLGINPTDLECLGVVSLGADVTAGGIARATGLTTGAVTGVIDRLEAAGLVRRERDADDRRKIYVRQTAKARARGGALYSALGVAVDNLAARYSYAELRLLVDYFVETRDIMLGEIERLQSTSKARSPRRE